MDSETAAELAECNQHILECLKKHQDICPAPLVYSPRWLNSFPLRLLDVHIRHADRCYLVLGETTWYPYVTLSYVWGIPIQNLPKTIRDAIAVARFFRVDYVWVDALCIVQDDEAEWRVESSKMDSIYMGAYFTIAAVNATNCQESFFGRNINRAIVAPESNMLFDRSGPLFSRGWTLQERLLSSRILYFTNEWGIYYECSNNSRAIMPGDTIGRFRGQTSATTAYFLDNWLYLIVGYSRRELTVKSDILIALQGLIKYLQARTGFDIVYGHWQHRFLDQLFWNVSNWPQLGSPGPAGSGIRTNVAPSWSWASTNGHLRWVIVQGWPLSKLMYCTDYLLIKVRELGLEQQIVLKRIAAFPYSSPDDQLLTISGFVFPVTITGYDNEPVRGPPLMCGRQVIISPQSLNITISLGNATVAAESSRKNKAFTRRVEKRKKARKPEVPPAINAKAQAVMTESVRTESRHVCNIDSDRAELPSTTHIFMLETPSSPETADSPTAYFHFLMLELVHEPNYYQRVGYGRSASEATPAEQICRLKGVIKQEIMIV